MRFGIIYLTGVLAEAVTLERAQELNIQGYAVTVSSGRILIEKEKSA